jgi:HAD superfamily hydrolase (TIGR01490 family)
MNEKNEYAVFFDLDRTILRVNSGYAIGIAAYHHGYFKTGDLLKALLAMVSFNLGLRPAEEIISEAGKRMKGLGNDIIGKISEEAVDRYLLPSVFMEFYDEMSFHRSQGAHMTILSSTISPVCERLALKLGFDSVLCTCLEEIDGKLTGHPSENYCYGPEKKKRLLEFCSRNGFDQSKSWCYADSISDFGALEVCGNRVCINPDHKLKKEALKRGWEIRTWGRRK